MRVHEFEGAMVEDEIEYYVHHMGWWAVCEQQVLVFFHEVNHSCYAFFVQNVCVQRRDISCDKEGIGWKGWEFFSEVEKMFCVLTCDGRLLAHIPQILGTSMGTSVAPPYANLFMSQEERTIILTFLHLIYFWKCFIDDIFFIFLGFHSQLNSLMTFMNTISPTVKYTFTYS